MKALLMYGGLWTLIWLICQVAVALRPQPRRVRPESADDPWKLPRATFADAAAARHPVVDEAEVRQALRRRLGVAWQADQARVKARAYTWERKIERLLRGTSDGPEDFHALTELHEQSLLAADEAHRHLSEAWLSAADIAASIAALKRRTAAEPDGQHARALEATRESLARDKALIEAFAHRYYEDVSRLNAQLRRLKLAIAERFGEPGRRWREELDARLEQARRTGATPSR